MKPFFLSIALLTIITCFCQQQTKLNITESVDFKDDVRANEVLSMHLSNSNLMGVVRDSKRNLLFDIFNPSLIRLNGIEIEKPKNEDFCGELFFENTIKIFTVYSPSKKERILYCYEFNINDATHKKTELFKTNVENNQKIFSGANKRQTAFAMSPNGQYFTILTDDIKKNASSYTVHVYNSKDLVLLYEKKYQENTEKFYEPNDVYIDDSATVYTLGKLFLEGRSEKKENKNNYNFILNKLTQTSINTLSLNFNDNTHIRSLVISGQEDKIRLLGFYSQKNVSNIKGLILFDVNAELMEILQTKSHNLPEKVYNDLYSTAVADKKKDKELSNFYVDHVLKDSFGNTYLLAEEYFVTSVYVSMGMNGGYWQTVYHYDDVLAIKLNKEGELEWGRSIFKRATAPSYNAFIKDEQLHVVLNSGKNLIEKEDGRVKVSKGLFESSSLYDIVYNSEGDVSYDKIQDNKNKTYYSPYFGIFKENRFITIGHDEGKKRFLILE
ncbi:hypothetical protein [Confluentibacter sediminis]|uniref:hypothetical protein n=1 Tax=Confluentibacter sediminis TaxID=2219045 RepID=UPI000DAC72F2|nr:hypothetical protein [Confluentibacter sediminis]